MRPRAGTMSLGYLVNPSLMDLTAWSEFWLAMATRVRMSRTRPSASLRPLALLNIS